MTTQMNNKHELLRIWAAVAQIRLKQCVSCIGVREESYYDTAVAQVLTKTSKMFEN